MTTIEECAVDILLFDAKDEKLLDIKCFRGDREDVSAEDIKTAIHSGIMQHKMQPSLASPKAPELGVDARDIVALLKDLPVAA